MNGKNYIKNEIESIWLSLCGDSPRLGITFFISSIYKFLQVYLSDHYSFIHNHFPFNFNISTDLCTLSTFFVDFIQVIHKAFYAYLTGFLMTLHNSTKIVHNPVDNLYFLYRKPLIRFIQYFYPAEKEM